MTTTTKVNDHVRITEGKHSGLTGTVTEVGAEKYNSVHVKVRLDNSPMSVIAYAEFCEPMPSTDQIIWLTGWSQDYEGEREIDLYPTLESATLHLSVAVDEQFGDTDVLNWKFRRDVIRNGTVRWEYSDHTITAQPYKLSDILAKA